MEGQNHRKRPHKKRPQGGNYTEAFKQNVVRDYHEGDQDQRMVGSRFGVSQGSVQKWVQKYSVAIVQKCDIGQNCDMAKKQGKEDGSKEALKQQIKELELALEQERLKRLGWQTMVEIAEKELKIDIRKKSDTKQSKG